MRAFYGAEVALASDAYSGKYLGAETINGELPHGMDLSLRLHACMLVSIAHHCT